MLTARSVEFTMARDETAARETTSDRQIAGAAGDSPAGFKKRQFLPNEPILSTRVDSALWLVIRIFTRKCMIPSLTNKGTSALESVSRVGWASRPPVWASRRNALAPCHDLPKLRKIVRARCPNRLARPPAPARPFRRLGGRDAHPTREILPAKSHLYFERWYESYREAIPCR
jgi:hypothetical protein